MGDATLLTDRAIRAAKPTAKLRKLSDSGALQIAGPLVPWQLVVIVAFWAAALFFGYGLFAPNNAAIIIALALAALSIGSRYYLRQPYTGVFRISPGSLREAIKFLSR